MRCWRSGQSGKRQSYREDFDGAKVNLMYEVNRAKYTQHPQLQAELLSTGVAEIVGGPSTSWRWADKDWTWSFWNGTIQMRIREELRAAAERDGALLARILAQFAAYNGAPGFRPTPLGAVAESESETDAGPSAGGGVASSTREDRESAARMAQAKLAGAPLRGVPAVEDALSTHADQLLPWLWLGGENAAWDSGSLCRHGITHVFLPAFTGHPHSPPPVFEGKFMYLIWPVMDVPGVNPTSPPIKTAPVLVTVVLARTA